MDQDTNSIQQKRATELIIDDTDRKLLTALAEDSSQSYSGLGAKVHLSAPAVHERVKKMKTAGVIKKSTINLDGTKIGRPFLAFIHVNYTGTKARDNFARLHEDADVEEIHSVAGDSCLLIKARCKDANGLDKLLIRMREFGDVTNTRSHIVLTTLLERGPQAELD
ncbi:Lrp/AsnC family transcriptional regulator [Sphingorhabdus sp. EL138]|uniref:Lrp/AsnC family transcriptional regulator n=1 Tax=Sphingorhabdus sp. EL138 TaxID=2073156 RepID=UPI000D68F16A|nr:Lrp/AsnC family transcriptional regulator [Sphingorhabdus sp. EL138]